VSFLSDEDRRARAEYKRRADEEHADRVAASKQAFEELRPKLAETIEASARETFVRVGEVAWFTPSYRTSVGDETVRMRPLLNETLAEEIPPLVAEVLQVPISSVRIDSRVGKSENEALNRDRTYTILFLVWLDPPLR